MQPNTPRGEATGSEPASTPRPACPSLALDGDWEFAPDDDGFGFAQRWFDGMRALPERITVPGCWQAQGVHGHAAGYRRQVVVPADWRDRLVWLRFGGVSARADVWVNGRPALTHEGLLAPFDGQIGSLLITGDVNTIVVRVASFDYPGDAPPEQAGTSADLVNRP